MAMGKPSALPREVASETDDVHVLKLPRGQVDESSLCSLLHRLWSECWLELLRDLEPQVLHVNWVAQVQLHFRLLIRARELRENSHLDHIE